MNTKLDKSNRFRTARCKWDPDAFFFAEHKKDEDMEDRHRACRNARENYPLPSNLLDIPPLAAIGPCDDCLVELTTREQALGETARLNRESIASNGLAVGIEWHCVVELSEVVHVSSSIMPFGSDPANLTIEEWREVHRSARVVEPTKDELSMFGDSKFVADCE